MSARDRAILGCALLLALSACSRGLPTPWVETRADDPEISQPAAPAPELAGGPRPDAAPDASTEAPQEAPTPAADQPAEPPPPASAPLPRPEPDLEGPAPELAGGPRESRGQDPLETVNRRLYAVDQTVGRTLVERTRALRREPPHTHSAFTAVRHVLDNLDEPGFAANDLLQFKFARALKAAARFVINSTIGVAGVSDVARRMGIHRRSNSLDRTLARYGAPSGPYLYVPLAGPTTLRAVFSAAAEGYLYPPHWVHLAAGIQAAVRGAGYAKMAQSAMDRPRGPAPGPDGYARARKAYYQAKAAQKTSYAARPPRAAPTAVASNEEALD